MRRTSTGVSWQLEPVARCPLCGLEDNRATFARPEKDDWRGRYELCKACGLVFQSPRPTAASLAAFYQREYLESTLDSEADEQRDRWVQQQRAAHFTEFAGEHIDRVELHLDVGASRGTLMRSLQARFGCRTLGVEPGEQRRREAIDAGLDLVGSIEALPTDIHGRVDLVTMGHVLEHLQQPVEELSQMRSRLLTPDGWLLLEVPNLLCHAAFERAHLHAFTAGTLERTLRAAGFDVVELVEHGRPHSRRFPLYLLALAKAAGAPPNAEELRSGASPLALRLRRSSWRAAYGASYWVWRVKSALAGAKAPPWAGG